MSSLRLYTSLLLTVVTVCILHPVFAMAGAIGGSSIILGSTALDTCTTQSIECHEVSEDMYVCEDRSKIVGHAQNTIREIPTGEPHAPQVLRGRNQKNISSTTPRILGSEYSPSHVFRYPFVRVIKIQV